MTKEQFWQAADETIYLVWCALHEMVPDSEEGSAVEGNRPHDPQADLATVFSFAEWHKMGAVVAMALRSAGDMSEKTIAAAGAAVRKAAIFEQAWRVIREKLEAAGIWYMPLKGAVLQDYYPAFGMREMSDYDILVDPDRSGEVKKIMEGLGYSTERFGPGGHDVYRKDPVLNFEIHKALFEKAHKKEFYEYFHDVRSRLIPGEGHGFHLSPEDTYLYLIAHEHKHYSGGGTGLRSLADTYIYLSHEKPDPDYVKREAQKLDIAEFEECNRSLALHIFGRERLSRQELPEAEREMLEYILTSGTYGTFTRRVENKMRAHNWNKLQYILHRLYVPISKKSPNYAQSAAAHPNFYRCRLFVPFLPLYRVLRSIRAGRFKGEFKALWRLKI